jgi:hypothetical protein
MARPSHRVALALIAAAAVTLVVVGQPVGCPGNVKADSDCEHHVRSHRNHAPC